MVKNMKKINVLMFLIIGILSLNFVCAGTVSRPFLIKGDFQWSAPSGAGTQHPCNSDTAGDCKIFLYAGSDFSTNLLESLENRKLTTSEITNLLSSGMLTDPIDLDGDSAYINFTLVIKSGAPTYANEVLSVDVQVPNPNAPGTTHSAKLLEYSEHSAPCNSANVGEVRLMPTGLSKCERLEGSSYSWGPFSSGASGGLDFRDFHPALFATCPVAGCYYYNSDSGEYQQASQTANMVTLRPGSIDSRYLSSKSVSLNNLSQEVIDYIDSKESVENITYHSETTEINMIDLQPESISLDHLNQEIKNRLGSVQEYDEDFSNTLGLEAVETLYYTIYDENTGSSYYIPVYRSTDFTISAIRDLITYGEFDSTFERKTGTGYSNAFPPNSISSNKYSDFIYPRLDPKYIAKDKYIPIHVQIGDTGAQNYKISFYECESGAFSNYYYLHGFNLPITVFNDADDCSKIPAARIKGQFGGSPASSGGDVTVSVDQAGYSHRYHIKQGTSDKKIILTVVSETGGSPTTKVQISSVVSHVYNQISDIDIELPVYCSKHYVAPSTSNPQGYNHFDFQDLVFTATGGSSGSTASETQRYFRWNIGYIDINEDSEEEIVYFVSDKRDNKRTGLHNVSLNSPNISNSVRLVVWIYDTRTGQRFAKYFQINNCTDVS